MNSIIRQVIRAPVLKLWTTGPSNYLTAINNARALSHLSKGFNQSLIPRNHHQINCQCGCASRFSHSKTAGERELVEYLNDEIAIERQALTNNFPKELDGFNVKYDGAAVELTKQAGAEKIVVTFNVNHTVDSEDDNQHEMEENKEGVKMRSTPNFDVDIVRGDTTLGFSCTFLKGQPQDNEYDDVFGIEEISIYKGEFQESSYACSGDVLDGYLYDLLMNLLEEKGVSSDFVIRLSDLSTEYEHSHYVNLLEALKKFA